jgi:hypothetical protein
MNRMIPIFHSCVYFACPRTVCVDMCMPYSHKNAFRSPADVCIYMYRSIHAKQDQRQNKYNKVQVKQIQNRPKRRNAVSLDQDTGRKRQFRSFFSFSLFPNATPPSRPRVCLNIIINHLPTPSYPCVHHSPSHTRAVTAEHKSACLLSLALYSPMLGLLGQSSPPLHHVLRL